MDKINKAAKLVADYLRQQNQTQINAHYARKNTHPDSIRYCIEREHISASREVQIFAQAIAAIEELDVSLRPKFLAYLGLGG